MEPYLTREALYTAIKTLFDLETQIKEAKKLQRKTWAELYKNGINQWPKMSIERLKLHRQALIDSGWEDYAIGDMELLEPLETLILEKEKDAAYETNHS